MNGRQIAGQMLRHGLQRRIRLLLVDAMNERARTFYLRFGSEESPTEELNLQMIIKDIKAVIYQS